MDAEAKAKASARVDAQAQADARSPPRKKKSKGGSTVSAWAAALLPALMAVSQLRNSGWVRLPAVYSDCGLAAAAQGGGLPTVSTATVLEAIRDPSHPWQGIFNGERAHAHASEWTRFHGASDRWEPQVSGFIGDTLQHYGLLECADGRRTKHVAYCHALRSKAMAVSGEGDAAGAAPLQEESSEQASVLGRQPLHSDAPPPKEGSLSDLEAADCPLSVMVAIEPDTKLWIFPSGCDHPEDALLIHLDVGDMLCWRGDLVHAGAGALPLLSRSRPPAAARPQRPAHPCTTPHSRTPPPRISELRWRAWPSTAIFVTLSLLSTGGAAPRVLSLASELVDPHARAGPVP